ncbi:lipoprotein-releasing ABC transporter permease subunit [Kiloniella laminariae]|uniref:Lipoprotein-releasing ABC transporter permease subunit n=1 Tax=Kiloniella laminariae TaxID=454162 RepID=A0ABT4LLP9_9PROT|nr:lipoprotein-releasing ABC transporter permease subunit [Kiloniella laminariae]MCZ4282019.1 lipoprotein-releasing ABC transporter permease subunit [Kiloniella laminariae]
MVFGAFERMVAWRYLRSRRKEGFISVIAGFSLVGIALGVATLIIVMAVMNGFRQELLGRILGINGHLAVTAIEGELVDYKTIAERIARISGVASATPQVQGQVMVTAKGTATGGLVRGMATEDLQARKLISEKIVGGTLDDFAGDDAVVIGARLAQSLGLTVGDSVTLVSPNSSITVFGSIPRLKAYTIVALFDVGMYEYDSSFIYMPLEAAQIFFELPDQVNAIEVFVNDVEQTTAVRREIHNDIGYGIITRDWQQNNASFFNAIQVERNVMFLILSLIILVAVFNIVSGQIMLVKDKGRDIAILRTMGATSGMVLRIFFLSGASIGVFGTLVGFILGLSFAENIETIRQWLESLSGTNLFVPEVYFLSKLPAVVEMDEVIQIVGMALFFSFLAPIFPAWRAARLDPVEAIRYE